MFRGVLKNIWRTFEGPEQLYDAVAQLKGLSGSRLGNRIVFSSIGHGDRYPCLCGRAFGDLGCGIGGTTLRICYD